MRPREALTGTRPRERLVGGTGVSGGIDVPPNQWMNRAIREAAWDPRPIVIDIEPEQMTDTMPHAPAAPNRFIREAARRLSHRIRR